jgi:hypothetical protein
LKYSRAAPENISCHRNPSIVMMTTLRAGVWAWPGRIATNASASATPIFQERMAA